MRPSFVHTAAQDPRAAILAAKLRPPHKRDGIIARSGLVDRMSASGSEPVVAVVAPAGYGKTTVLAEWVSRQTSDVAWISVDESDNDPSTLLAAAAVALGQAHAIDPKIVDSVTARNATVSTALAALTSSFNPSTSMTLVLDHVEAVECVESLDLIAELVWRLPSGSRLAYASRSPLPLPTPLLRSRGALVEIGVEDLAMDREEAQQLLRAAGAELSDDEMEHVFEQTEGWPAGLYLAGLASKARRPGAPDFAFRGDDIMVGDYFRTEILSHLPSETVSFLTRTSVLDQLSGPLCDAVLGAQRSQSVLESLEVSNLLLVPLDRQRVWYRYHRLFRDLLGTELERREPALVSELHRRAAVWFAEHGMPESGIRHAQQARDSQLVGRLVATNIHPAYSVGRAVEVRSWLEWFRTESLVEQHPDVAALGAVVEALAGRAASTERWAAAAEADSAESHGDPFEAWLAFMRALLCRQGPARMRADAQLALEKLDANSGLRPVTTLCEALSYLLEGELDSAAPVLTRAYDLGVYFGTLPSAAVTSALRALIAIRRGNWGDAALHKDRALATVETGNLHDYLEASIVFAMSAQVAIHAGDLRLATDYITRAARLRPLLTYACPPATIFQLEIARTYLQLDDSSGALTVLREIRDILHQRPDLGVVASQVAEMDAAVDATKYRSAGASSLTTAELRLLPFLATHLSFPEIGLRLYVSRHTVKTQANSIYRKFGVTSRSDAIRYAQNVGLLAN